MAPRPVLVALAEQQKTIDELKRQNKWLYTAVNRIATVAGLRPVTADEHNPADPIPDPASEAPYQTTEEARNEGTNGDVEAIGGVPGATDVSANSTTTVDQVGGISADTPYSVNEEVTKPVSGTEGPLPLDQVRTRPEIQFGNPLKPEVAFPINPSWGDEQKLGSAPRTYASLRLAKLRIAAGLASGDELVLAQQIQTDAAVSDQDIATQIETLGSVLRVQGSKSPQTRTARNLVPREAARQVDRTVPSISGGGVQAIASSSAGFDDDAFSFTD